MVMQNLVSERIKKKAETIIVIKEDEIYDKIYFNTIWMSPKDGKHEYSVIYSKEDKPLLDRFDCSCIFCSNYNVIDQRMCAYKYAVFEWLVGAGILRKELLCEDEAV